MSNITQTLAKLRILGEMPFGWDNGAGEPANAFSMVGAKLMLRLFMELGFSEFDVVPGFAGKVVVFGFMNGSEVEIVCDVDEVSLIYTKSSQGVEEEVDDKTYGEAIAFVRGLSWLSKKSSTLSAYNVILRQRVALVAKQSPSHAMAAAYRSSVPNVSERVVIRSANTFTNTRAMESGPIRQFSGDFECQIMMMAPA